jgi:hypothetical protein
MNSCWTGQVPRAEWSAGKEVSKFQGQLEGYLAEFFTWVPVPVPLHDEFLLPRSSAASGVECG